MDPVITDCIQIRRMVKEDVSTLLELIKDLAAFEKAPASAVKMTEAQLLRDGFGDQPRYQCFIAEFDKKSVGFALYFFTYSTWEGLCLYLDDIFVREEFRGKGVGTSLMKALATEVLKNDCSRFLWQVLDWNKPAIDYYVNKMMAVERLEDGAKWMNMILRPEGCRKFIGS